MKVEDFAKQFASENGKADTIVLDPPRDGLYPSAIPHILSFGAREIIYVSCNPATLVRDISIMTSPQPSPEGEGVLVTSSFSGGEGDRG